VAFDRLTRWGLVLAAALWVTACASLQGADPTDGSIRTERGVIQQVRSVTLQPGAPQRSLFGAQLGAIQATPAETPARSSLTYEYVVRVMKDSGDPDDWEIAIIQQGGRKLQEGQEVLLQRNTAGQARLAPL
jgi:hypothetical protein